uniref:Uncharacterized protein n=1 Tax=Daphnia magna TaxID=35525 RepID=A0A0P6JR27_9CRUS
MSDLLFYSSKTIKKKKLTFLFFFPSSFCGPKYRKMENPILWGSLDNVIVSKEPLASPCLTSLLWSETCMIILYSSLLLRML